MIEVLPGRTLWMKSNIDQPAPKYHTKGCSRSSVDSPGARTLVFVAFEPFLGAEFRASIARTPFCAILWRSPNRKCFNHVHVQTKGFTKFLVFLKRVSLLNPRVRTNFVAFL